MPPLAQADFDRLLWSCDLNFVRGEDSLVRAFWAGAPWVWQAYRQQDGAPRAKIEALLDLFLADAPPALARRLRRLFAAWNGLGGSAPGAWRASTRPNGQPMPDAGATASPPLDLTSQLMAFVASKG
jgi:uncharacterized repeat protein (TIGR03837 family)